LLAAKLLQFALANRLDQLALLLRDLTAQGLGLELVLALSSLKKATRIRACFEVSLTKAS